MRDIVTLVNGKPQGYVSSTEFAKMHNIAEVTVRVWIRRKKIEGLKVGNQWFIKPETPYPVEKKRGRRSVNCGSNKELPVL